MGISFEDWTVVRWARTAAGVDVTDSADIQEPAGGSKDTGFTSGGGSDNFWRQWFNWFFQNIGKGLEYLVALFDGLDLPAQVARSEISTGGADITGLSGSSTIAAHQVIVAGRLYDVPETVVSVPVQSSLAVMHRLVVTRISGGVPSVVLLDGTAEASDPNVATTEVKLWRLVQETGVATYTSEDLREYGVYAASRVEADQDLIAPNRVLLGAGGESVDLDPARPEFARVGGLWRITAAKDADGNDISKRHGHIALDPLDFISVGGSPTIDADDGVTLTTSGDIVSSKSLQFPPGARVSKVTVNYTVSNSLNGIAFILFRRARQSATRQLVDQNSDANVTGAGFYELETTAPPIDHEVLRDSAYTLQVQAGASHNVTIIGALIEYEWEYPFAGWELS